MKHQQENKDNLPLQETALFCKQVALILKSGIPLRDGLEILYDTYKNSKNADKFDMFVEGIEKNNTFYDSIKSMDLFSAYMVNMVRIGEKTGKLDEVMESLGEYYSIQAKIQKDIRNAILYPSILIAMMAVVIIVLVIKVLPIFDQIYKNLGTELFSASPSIINFGMITGKIILVVISLVLLAIITILLLLESKYKDAFIEKISRKFLFIQRIQQKIAAWRFASVISMMVTSGYPMEEVFDLAPTVIFDRIFREKIEQCRKLTAEDNNFAEAVSEVKIFDGIQSKMISVGSAAGQMDKVMKQIADIYAEEIDDNISYAISLTEPTLVAILSVVIGGILLTVMLPLVSIISSLG